ncbi:hypothetical protein [Enterococcus thailandicus]|nr:hypothetical protein [Enterococcus thailandicus]OJG94488.1 hypothetical protein RV17_GL000492 [Enterococcus thailandicus]
MTNHPNVFLAIRSLGERLLNTSLFVPNKNIAGTKHWLRFVSAFLF